MKVAYNMTAPIAVIAVAPTGKASDEAKGSIQWKMCRPLISSDLV